MIRRMLGKHNKIIAIILASCLVLWLGITLICTLYAKKKAQEPVFIETMIQDCHYFPAETSFTEEALFQSGINELRLVFGTAGAKIYESPEAVRYIEKEEKAISAGLPVYQKNGATLYFPSGIGAYRLYCDDFTVEQGIGEAWLSYGALFNTENVKAFKKSVFLVDFGGGVYVNALPVTVEAYRSYTVPANSVLYFYEDNLAILAFEDGVLNRYYIPVNGQTMLKAENVRVSYYSLYRFCKEAQTTDTPQMEENGVVLEGDYYYYFLGQRFEIKGPSFLYETKDGLFLENETEAFLLPDAPLYEADGNRVVLPRDYMMLQMNQRLYSCLPATTTVKRAEEAVYVSYKDTLNSYQEILLHDGEEHYVVLNESVFRMDDIELTISPLSSFYISDTMEICFYQYDSEEYFTFYTAGQEPELVLANGDVVYLYERLIRRKDGTLDLLQNKPSVFPVIQ